MSCATSSACPLREEEAQFAESRAEGSGGAAAAAALDRATRPRLPAGVDPGMLRARVRPGQTVVMTCGNPDAVEDVRRVSERLGLRLEREEW